MREVLRLIDHKNRPKKGAICICGAEPHPFMSDCYASAWAEALFP